MKAVNQMMIGLLVTACQSAAPATTSSSASAASDDVDAVSAATVPSNLAPLAWTLGDWRCTGAYTDLPPVSVAHEVTASFDVFTAVGDTWITGLYQEKKTAQNPAPVSLSDHISIDESVDQGIRSAVDSHLGRIINTFSGYDGDTTTYTGSYLISGATLPFSETLVRVDNHTFTTNSQLDLGAGPQTFQTLTCRK